MSNVNDVEGLGAREASRPEPPPKPSPNGVCVVEAIRDMLPSVGVPPSWKKAVMELIAERDAYGLAKYGTRLYTHNGRNAVEDARQEAGDLLQYIAQALIEGHGERLWAAIRPVLDVVDALSGLGEYR